MVMRLYSVQPIRVKTRSQNFRILSLSPVAHVTTPKVSRLLSSLPLPG
jgi:hypothetical protein